MLVFSQASVTFLPILQEPCTFDLLVYTDTSADVPQTWENSDPKFISDSTEVCAHASSARFRAMQRFSYLWQRFLVPYFCLSNHSLRRSGCAHSQLKCTKWTRWSLTNRWRMTMFDQPRPSQSPPTDCNGPKSLPKCDTLGRIVRCSMLWASKQLAAMKPSCAWIKKSGLTE